MIKAEHILARRMGKTVHVSPLRMKLLKLAKQFPAFEASCLEDWLIELANARGARIITRHVETQRSFSPPPIKLVSNEELVVCMCQLQCLDRPQMLRLAAQLISRHAVCFSALKLIAEQERTGLILAELSKQALRVEPEHVLWRQIYETFQGELPVAEPVLHWTRLAEPIMRHGRCNAAGWRLVS